MQKIKWLWWLWFGKRGIYIDGKKVWPVEKQKAPIYYRIAWAGYGICIDQNGHIPNGFGI